ncbi:hypothetical protein [Asticcacaulis machinosus]|uniref:Secreted protein n=1 Tax=Asticcacaulis machinosus TaxID=2984211 RepID=A0ABT5HMA7_9CAUL|nr:hypothetical protein [Asticcacaulis machinosus]MDC7677389.1 hypothetical protein [Asticcacaulis machinosus]
MKQLSNLVACAVALVMLASNAFASSFEITPEDSKAIAKINDELIVPGSRKNIEALEALETDPAKSCPLSKEALQLFRDARTQIAEISDRLVKEGKPTAMIIGLSDQTAYALSKIEAQTWLLCTKNQNLKLNREAFELLVELESYAAEFSEISGKLSKEYSSQNTTEYCLTAKKALLIYDKVIRSMKQNRDLAIKNGQPVSQIDEQLAKGEEWKAGMATTLTNCPAD